MKSWMLLMLSLLLWWRPLPAGVEVLAFDTPAQEALYKQLVSELRCLVCQNQNLADSNADLAKDLRHQTYTMIKQGKNQQEIVDYMVQRYGDFVLYRPRLSGKTILLWTGPALLLFIGLLVVLKLVRQRHTDEVVADQQALSRARTLLDEHEGRE